MADTLAQALAEFQANPPVLVKSKAGHQSKYADLVQVNEQVLARLSDLGVIYTTAPTLLDDGKFVLLYELEHVASGTKAGGRYPLKLSDNPQAMGSGITYARRYALLAMTGVAAEDEDDDGQAASGRRTAQRATQPREKQRPPAPEQPTAQRAPRPVRPTAPPPLPGEGGGGITPPQQALLHKLLNDIGKGQRDAGLAYISDVLERDITTTKDLSKADAKQVIDRLQGDLTKQEQPA